MSADWPSAILRAQSPVAPRILGSTAAVAHGIVHYSAHAVRRLTAQSPCCDTCDIATFCDNVADVAFEGMRETQQRDMRDIRDIVPRHGDGIGGALEARWQGRWASDRPPSGMSVPIPAPWCAMMRRERGSKYFDVETSRACPGTNAGQNRDKDARKRPAQGRNHDSGRRADACGGKRRSETRRNSRSVCQRAPV